MARKILVLGKDGAPMLLTERPAADEVQLQELMKANPDLLPTDEFGLTGPLMVVGRETTLPSGSVDLVALARTGDLLIIEFKTGPQNTEFRHALAQLLDYGADLWGMSYQQFEDTVAHRYFVSDHCMDERTRGKKSLEEAVRAVWPDLTDEEAAQFRDRLTAQLSSGAFSYVVAAQDFTPTMTRTIEYLNNVLSGPRIYALELVRFEGEMLTAFESRTVSKPQPTSRVSVSERSESKLLDGIADQAYREALQELLDNCRSLGLRLELGTVGASIRLRVREHREPVSVAWLFPPGVSGWMGLTDLTLGFDLTQAERAPSEMPVLERYAEAVKKLAGAVPVKGSSLKAYHLAPEVVVRTTHQIVEILGQLVAGVGGGEVT